MYVSRRRVLGAVAGGALLSRRLGVAATTANTMTGAPVGSDGTIIYADIPGFVSASIVGLAHQIPHADARTRLTIAQSP